MIKTDSDDPIERLESWIPECTPDCVPAEDRDAPFLSEAFLYPVLGKEDARTLLALWRRVREASRG